MMDSLTARRIVNAAIRENPDLKAALDLLYAEKVSLGEHFERSAMLGSKADHGKEGGRPVWPHWSEAMEIDANLDKVGLSKTNRAQIIRRRMQESGIENVPTVRVIAGKLKKYGPSEK